MYLTKSEERILDGEEGQARQLAMKLLAAIGDAYQAPRMIKVRSAQISGVSYKTIGEPGLDFLKEISSGGAVATIRAMLNPAGMDLARWKELRVPKEFAEKQFEIMQCFKSMKVEPTCTCIPYHGNGAPLKAEHIAWAESSAVVFANSVLGARTNREGGPTALASSILGLSPLYGMHVEEERRPTHLVNLECKLNTDLDYSLLGYWMGRSLASSVPKIKGLPKASSHDRLKALCASMAASGSISMFVWDGNGQNEQMETVSINKDQLSEIDRLLSSNEDFQHVALGCPHLSLDELKLIANLASGRKTTKKLWCFTSRYVRDAAQQQGYVAMIEETGGRVICDTCIVVSPMAELGMDGIVTNSCKAAHYLRSLNRVETRLMSLEKCIEYAFS